MEIISRYVVVSFGNAIGFEIEEFVSRWAEMSDYEIECEIIRMAIDLSVEVDEKRYPDLFFWNQARP